MKKIIITFLIILLFACSLFAKEGNLFLETEIKFSKTTLTVKQALDEINSLTEISVAYNGNDTFLDYKLVLPSKRIKVKEALKIIEEQAPVEIIFNKNHVIVKQRKLKESYLLKGTVKDAGTGEVLPGATLQMQEYSKGTTTGANGEFNLKLKPGNYNFEIRYIGYKNKQFLVNLFDDKTITVFLEAKQEEIKEVQVTGRHTDIQSLEKGRNIEHIEAKTIEKLSYNNPADALQGRVNGVWSTRVSGAPGDHQKIRIRGINSLFSAVDPLYVINGVPIPVVNLSSLGIADINSRDIENITVLKDVSSTAWYGYQGGNGVIKIETKKGGGKNRINFTSRTGFQLMDKRYPLMNSKEFLQTMVKIDTVFPDHFNAFPRYFTYPVESGIGFIQVDRFVYPFPYDTTEYISDDWQDELFQTGVVQEYQITFRGTAKKLEYYISGNYYDHKGTVIHSNYEKYSYNVNLSAPLFKNLFIDFTGFGSIQKNKNNLDCYFGNLNILQGINIEPEYNSLSDFEKSRIHEYPVSPGSNSDLYKMIRTKEMYAFLTYDIPTLYIDKLQDGRDFFSLKNHALNVLSNNFGLGLTYNILPGLYFSNRFSLMRKDYLYESIIRENSLINISKQLASTENYRVLSNNLDIKYEKEVKGHTFNASASYRVYRDQIKWNVDSVKDMDIDEIDKTSEMYIKGSNALYGKSGNVVRDIRSLVFHAGYSYKDKYSVSAILNFDHLEEGNYIRADALFPSLAINWDLSKEFGLKEIKALDELSLYVNWGRVGNYPLNSLSNDLNSETVYSDIDGYERAVYISNLANHNLKHEEAEEINYGLRVHLFQNRLMLNANYFSRENRNLIFNRQIPYYYGGGFIMKNLGNMEHKGLELSIDAYPVETKHFEWNSTFGYSFDKQRVTNIFEDNDTLLFNTSEILIPEFSITKNNPLGNIIGYRYEGKWSEEDEAIHDAGFINHKGIKYFKNDTANHALTYKDKVVIGNSLPDFTCHWINNFRFKNISINMHWYAVVGVDKFNATRASTYYSLLNEEVSTFVDEAIPHFMDQVFYESSYFVEDASFVKLKTLSFMYSPAQKLFGVLDANFSLSFENLVTISNYKGYDPEATVYTGNNFSDNAVDIGAYPSPGSVFITIDVTF